MEPKISVHPLPHMDATQISISLPTIAVAVSNASMEYSEGDYAKLVAQNLMNTLNSQVHKAVGVELEKLADSPDGKDKKFSAGLLEGLKTVTDPDNEKVTWTDVENAYKDWAPTELESDHGHPTEAALEAICEGLKEKVYCPEKDECGYTFAKISVSSAIQHLNDSAHNWSREQIADWLETLDIDININMKEDNNAD